LKIALISEWLDPWRGGAETSTLQFLYQLLEEGIEVHLFTRSRPSGLPGLFVHTVSGAAMSRTRRSVTFSSRVERMIRSESFDVIHAVTPCRFADVYQPRGGTIVESIERNLALLRSAPSRALKRYVNHFNIKQRHALKMEREIFKDPNGPVVIAISDYVARQLEDHYALPSHRIRKVFNAVEVWPCTPESRLQHRQSIRGEFGIGADDCLVVTVAHNFRLKGVRRWMEALSQLLERGVKDVRALVVGRDDSVQWRRLADRLGVSGYLTFTGPSDRVREMYHAADMLVHPTYYDPCSRVVLEAMTEGLPCITTRWDGAAEMVRHGENGFVLEDPEDIGTLADYVDAMRDPGLRYQLGRDAAKIADSVSMAGHAEALIELYRELCATPKAATQPICR
jgi:UDP-glucose:(heptosyl)LPS alpha-1,3-glucosyltransferase